MTSAMLSRVLLVCIGIATALSLIDAQSLPQTFELSTVRPAGNGLWTGDEWLIDLSAADAAGHVKAQLRSGSFVSLQHLSDLPISWRNNAAARMPGLDSVYFLHHMQDSVQWMWASFPDNSTTVMFPVPTMSRSSSCLVYDEKLGQFYAGGAQQVGTSNTWTLTIFLFDGDEFQAGRVLTTVNLTRNGEASGWEPDLLQCGMNDALGVLSIHFPGTVEGRASLSDKQGSLLRFNISVALDWSVQIELLDVLSWPAVDAAPAPHHPRHPRHQHSSKRSAAEKAAPAPGTEVLGLASMRTVDKNLLGFVRTQPSSTSSDVTHSHSGSSSIATLGWLDPSSGVEVRSYSSSEVASYVAPYVVYHRISRQLLVLEMAAPYRYTVVRSDDSQPIKTGTVSFAVDEGHVIMGAYARDETD